MAPIIPDPKKIKSWNDLIPGDVLGTVQGHRGGKDVDYGLYGGKKDGVHFQFYNGGGAGPKWKPQTEHLSPWCSMQRCLAA